MGLMDRARELRSAVTPKRGLLSRAQALADQTPAHSAPHPAEDHTDSPAVAAAPSRKTSPNVNAPAPAEARRGGGGLLSRARAVRDAGDSGTPETERPMGLLRRALGLRGTDEPARLEPLTSAPLDVTGAPMPFPDTGAPYADQSVEPVPSSTAGELEPPRELDIEEMDFGLAEPPQTQAYEPQPEKFPQQPAEIPGSEDLPDLEIPDSADVLPDELELAPLSLDADPLDFGDEKGVPGADDGGPFGELQPEPELEGLTGAENLALDTPADLPAEDTAALSPGDAMALGVDDLSSEDQIFSDWEREALEDAEQSFAAADTSQSKGDEPEFLFDSDSDSHTLPAEAHIGSQKKLDHYLSLIDIAKEITTIDDFDELWENLLYAVMGQVGAESIVIFSSPARAETAPAFYPVASSHGIEAGENWVLKPGDALYDSLRKSPALRYADEYLSGEPISTIERNILEAIPARVVVPLHRANRLYGILFLGPPLSGADYSAEDMEFLGLLGEVAAVGVDRVLSRIEYERDTEDLKRRNKAAHEIFTAVREASALKDLDSVYDLIGRYLDNSLGIESYSVVLLTPASQEYRIFGGNQVSPASIEKFSLKTNSNLIARISNLTRVYDLENFRADGEITSFYSNDDLGLMNHYWILPLINLNWLVGFITIHRTKIPWTEFHRESAIAFSEAISPVVANCLVLGERETLFRDPFSPLEDRFELEIKRAQEFQSTVALVDLRIKNIRRLLALNAPETLAAFLGDVSRTISGFLFESDFMARVGQGRFALILPGRGREEAEIFVKKLKAEFRRTRLLKESPIEVQYIHTILASPQDGTEAGKMLAMLE